MREPNIIWEKQIKITNPKQEKVTGIDSSN